MSAKNIVVIGSSGHAKVAVDIIEREGRYHLVGLIDSFKPVGSTVFDYPVMGTEAELPALSKSLNLHGCFIAIGDNWQRSLMAAQVANLVPELSIVSATHPSAQIARGSEIGDGTILMAGAAVNSDCRVGRFCILNTRASLDHDGRIADFASLAPGATLGGNVTLGEFSAVGLGANVIHQVNIGAHVVIGAGALVLEDIPDHTVAYGMPAAVVRTRQAGEQYL